MYFSNRFHVAYNHALSLGKSRSGSIIFCDLRHDSWTVPDCAQECSPWGRIMCWQGGEYAGSICCIFCMYITLVKLTQISYRFYQANIKRYEHRIKIYIVVIQVVFISRYKQSILNSMTSLLLILNVSNVVITGYRGNTLEI